MPNHPRWTLPEYAGLIPTFLDLDDPDDAVTQIDKRHQFGGWKDFDGFKMFGSQEDGFFLCYPEDPPLPEVSRTYLREEMIVLFKSAWVAVVQRDDTYRIARID